ncbi:hypothetical protein CH380_07255 [Leptospira adleri]|uniref:(2Fe-2S) ferredoxin domain-containing protein n=2 Tax=Leptospira adleri TaxID=2023186 RepID=A0A2M9YQI9_9LEPT|nr:hypothetical protein CH380_07255 [Leptospira adleri]PJZ59823.1 hypothetical protein CH376_21725 [Leptospira adleri]
MKSESNLFYGKRFVGTSKNVFFKFLIFRSKKIQGLNLFSVFLFQEDFMLDFLNRFGSLKREKFPEGIETADGGWEGAILVCSQCAAKIPGESFLGKSRIKNELKFQIRSEKIDGIRILEVSCLNVCEKNKIAVANTFSSQTGERIAIVPPKTTARQILNFFGISKNETDF